MRLSHAVFTEKMYVVHSGDVVLCGRVCKKMCRLGRICVLKSQSPMKANTHLLALTPKRGAVSAGYYG
jgi:hypothetical protein